jgi:hypothetical protein
MPFEVRYDGALLTGPGPSVAYTGGCLCGAIAFRIESELAPIQVCHCIQCRKAQGGPFATNIPVEASAFRLLAGAQLLKAFESSPGKQRFFCGRCGSPVYSRRESLPSIVRVRAGLIDQPLHTQPAWHAYTASKCNWWPIDDDLPQYPEAYVPATNDASPP